MNVLFIGNSLTYYNNLCKVVAGIATEQGKKINCQAVTAGGQNLIYHSNSNDTLKAVSKGNWDVVVLQDIVSSYDSDKCITGSEALVSQIVKYNTNPTIMFYQPMPKENVMTQSEPYFSYGYLKALHNIQNKFGLNTLYAPAGEAEYDLYNNNNLDFYVDDGLHPHSIGTFVAASVIYYTLFNGESQITYEDTTNINNIINTNIAYSGDAVVNHTADELNTIQQKAYHYAHAVTAAAADKTGATKYTSIAGSYTDIDDEVDVNGCTPITGTVVDSSVFSQSDNIAKGCAAYASTNIQPSKNATDGNAGTRWESDKEDPSWLYVDLGSRKHIKNVGFIWEGAYAKKYYVQVSDDTINWSTVAIVTATTNETVQVPVKDNTYGRYVRMYGTKRGTVYGYSFWEMGIWEETSESYDVTVDNEKVATVKEGDTYKLGNATYGYYAQDKLYKPNSEYTVTSDISFTSINTMEISVTNGASIRTVLPAGLRYQVQITTDNIEALNNQNTIKEGLLITSNDIYQNAEESMTLDSQYATINIENAGWYKDTVGMYCGAIVNILNTNYTRRFISRAYVTLNYADNTSITLYSNMGSVRSVADVASSIKDAGYPNLTEIQKNIINQYLS